MVILSILVFLVILSVLVLIHELGHYLVAKKLNIKVEEFGFGFPPRAWGRKIGETMYSINWLPIGGFVKLYGEDDAGGGSVKMPKGELPTKDLGRAFFNRSVPQRAAVVVAGVVMNVILAVVIYYVLLIVPGFRTEVPLIGNFQFFGVNKVVREDIYINAVSKNSPAQKAGIVPGDKIISLNDRPVETATFFSDEIKDNKGKEMTISWLDGKSGSIEKAVVIPRTKVPKNEGALGVGLYPMKMAVLSYDTPMQKTFSGFIHPANLVVYNFAAMGDLVQESFKEKTAEPIGMAVAGPIGIFKVVDSFLTIPNTNDRALQLLNLAGLLSISLAIFNILPIPALDGGRLFFILLEGITGRKVNPKYETMIHTVGMVVLLGLLAIITVKDIFQFIIPR